MEERKESPAKDGLRSKSHFWRDGAAVCSVLRSVKARVALLAAEPGRGRRGTVSAARALVG